MLKIAATINKVETMVDKTLKLTIGTQELKAPDKAEIMELHGSIGWLVFAPQNQSIKEEDIPDEPIEFEGQKTYSERLRNVLFLLHQKQGGQPEDFESYRAKVMEKLIGHYKSKLDDLPN